MTDHEHTGRTEQCGICKRTVCKACSTFYPHNGKAFCLPNQGHNAPKSP